MFPPPAASCKWHLSQVELGRDAEKEIFQRGLIFRGIRWNFFFEMFEVLKRDLENERDLNPFRTNCGAPTLSFISKGTQADVVESSREICNLIMLWVRKAFRNLDFTRNMNSTLNSFILTEDEVR